MTRFHERRRSVPTLGLWLVLGSFGSGSSCASAPRSESVRAPPEVLEVVVFGGTGFSTEPILREPLLGGIAAPSDARPEAALDVVIPGGGRALIALRTRDAVTSVEARGGPVALWVLTDKDTACASDGDDMARCEWRGDIGRTYDLVVLNRGVYLAHVALTFD